MGAVEWGLDRIEALLGALGDPHLEFETLHIAGTNGKGSTATFAAAVLQAHGRRVGLYTSPHLQDIRERFVIDGAPAEDPILERVASRMLALPETIPATYFEVATALAFAVFREAGVEWAVIETGLGGRLDATNVVRPAAACVTTIGRDHAEVLGGTLEAIAAEKAGILKPGVPAVFGFVHSPAREVIEETAAEVGAPVTMLGGRGSVLDVETAISGTRFRYVSDLWPEGLALRSGLIGRHQASNAGLAILALQAAEVPLGADAVRSGIASATIGGRFEVRQQGGVTWVLDLAHNREGIEVVLQTLDEIDAPRPRVAVVSILADKPWSGMLGMLRLDMQAIILTQATSAPSARRWSLSEVIRVEESGATDVRVQPDFERALEDAAEAGAGGTVLVTGSTHTVGDARRALTAK